MCLQSSPCNFLVCVSGCNMKTERKRQGGRYVEAGELANCLAKNKPHVTQFVYRALIMSPERCAVGHMKHRVSRRNGCGEMPALHRPNLSLTVWK